MWLVYDLTNYGTGIYFGGLYRTKKEAEARLKYIEKNSELDEDGDSWRIHYIYKNVPIDYLEFDNL